MDKKNQVKVDRDFEDIVEPYLDHIRNDILLMRDYLNDSDFYNIQQICHQIKGSGGSFGFGFITECGELLEQAANDKDRDKIKHGLADLEGYLGKIEILFVSEDEL